jgi:hypothetical protein
MIRYWLAHFYADDSGALKSDWYFSALPSDLLNALPSPFFASERDKARRVQAAVEWERLRHTGAALDSQIEVYAQAL